MNKNLGLVSLFASALLFSAACGDDGDDNEVAVDATTNPSIDSGGGGMIDGSVQIVDATAPDATPAPDAMPSALDCAGDPLPTTVASPPITIAGPIQEATLSGVGTLAASTHVSANNYGDDSVITEGDFTGSFTVIDPNSSTTPLNAYVKATVSGYQDTYIFPGAPISENIPNAPLIMLSDSIFGLIGLLTGITTVQGTGTLTAAILDCNNDPISGAVVTITPNVGTIKYADATGVPGSDDFPSTQAAGVVYIFNVPPGEYTISSSAGGTALRDNDVKSFADSISTIQVIP